MSATAGLVALVVAVTSLTLVRYRPRPLRVTVMRAREPTRATTNERRRRSVAARVLRHLAPVILVAAVAGVIAATAALVAMFLWPRLRDLREQRRTASRANLAYPDFVDLLVLSIKSGYAPRQALSELLDIVPTAVRPGIATVLQRAETGQRFAEAVHGLQLAPPLGLGTIAQPLADSLALADRYGTPLAPILDRLADEARTQRRRNAEAAARRLPVQLSFPLVGCTLPSFVLLTVVPLMAGTFSSLRGLTP